MCKMVYLPTGVSHSVIHEVVCDPVVDPRKGDLVLLRLTHSHADEGGIRIRGLDMGVSLVVNLVHGCWRRHVYESTRNPTGSWKARDFRAYPGHGPRTTADTTGQICNIKDGIRVDLHISR